MINNINYKKVSFVLVILYIISILGLSYHIYTRYYSTPLDSVNVVTYTKDISKEDISTVVKDKNVESVYKEITNDDKEPTYTIESDKKLSNKELKKELSKNKDTKEATSILRKENKNTTYVYAVDEREIAQHGIGVYVGKTWDEHEFEAGVSIRNKRWIYSVGYTNKHNVSVRVGYEVIQW